MAFNRDKRPQDQGDDLDEHTVFINRCAQRDAPPRNASSPRKRTSPTPSARLPHRKPTKHRPTKHRPTDLAAGCAHDKSRYIFSNPNS